MFSEGLQYCLVRFLKLLLKCPSAHCTIVILAIGDAWHHDDHACLLWLKVALCLDELHTLCDRELESFFFALCMQRGAGYYDICPHHVSMCILTCCVMYAVAWVMATRLIPRHIWVHQHIHDDHMHTATYNQYCHAYLYMHTYIHTTYIHIHMHTVQCMLPSRQCRILCMTGPIVNIWLAVWAFHWKAFHNGSEVDTKLWNGNWQDKLLAIIG